MGLKLPDAISDEDVEFNQDGLSLIAKLIGGFTVLGIATAAATYLKNRVMDVAGAGEGANSLVNIN